MPIIKHQVITGVGVVIWYLMPDGSVGTQFYPYYWPC